MQMFLSVDFFFTDGMVFQSAKIGFGFSIHYFVDRFSLDLIDHHNYVIVAEGLKCQRSVHDNRVRISPLSKRWP